MKMKLYLVLGWMGVVALSAGATVRLSGVFSSDMVLQRGKPVPVWGRADPGEKISVSFAGQRVSCVADSKGEWEARLRPLEMCAEGRDLVVTSDSSQDSQTLHDVLVGDVWLVSGQSNAEMSFSWGILNGKKEIAKSKDFPNIRHLKFNHETSAIPKRFRTCTRGPWTVCGEKTLSGVTAVGYFFARDINARTGVPIGILDDNWSGCAIDPFICSEGWKAVTNFADTVVQVEQREKSYREEASRFAAEWAAGDEEAVAPGGGNGPAMQHNAMIEPIVRFPIAGALWYQGCSNWRNGMMYAKKLEALVAGWRMKWGYDFPFYIVQLASYHAKTTDPAGGDGYALIREAQRVAAQEIPLAGLAVAIDIGNAGDIHPKNKQDVGTRLACWARRDVYGEKDLVVSGPLYKSMKVDGNKVRVGFDFAGTGLMAGEKGPDTPGERPTATPDGKLRGFAIAGADKKWFWASAAIDGEEVVVSSPDVPNPVAVRYAYRGNPMGDCNLYNKEGLPASPFRTDDW